MESSLEKQKKLAYVARRYYLDDQKQSDIARELGVSRPLVSRMLSEARELGIVEITVHEPGAQTTRLMDRLRLSGSIRGGVLVEDGSMERETEELFAYVLEVASGRKVRSEEAGYHDMAIFKQGVTL